MSHKQKTCETCSVGFVTWDDKRRYCSPACFQRARVIAAQRTCGNCGKAFTPPNPNQQVCSRACQIAQHDAALIAPIEARVGESFGDYLRRRYIDEQATIRDLQVELGEPDNARRFIRWMNRYEIPLRSKSEAISLTHQRNPHMGAAFKERSGSLAWRERTARGRQSHPKLSGVEKAALSLLRELGLTVIPQYAEGIYNIDLALPDERIAIEIDGGRWHSVEPRASSDDARDEFLRDRGWTVERFNAEDFGRLLRLALSLKPERG